MADTKTPHTGQKKQVLLFLLVYLAFGSLFAQETTVSLDQAITDSARFLFGNLPEGSKIAVYGFSVPDNAKPELSKYIIDELVMLFSRERPHFTTVDRQNLETVAREMNLHLTFEISEETAKSIGKKTGADFIITGTVRYLDGMYRIWVKPITVEESEMYPIASANISGRDRRIRSLMEQGSSPWDTLHDPNRLYLGARAGLSMGFYNNGGGLADKSVYSSQTLVGIPAFDAALYASVPIWSLFAVQMEALITNDSFDLMTGNTSLMTVSYRSLMIPLLVKLVYQPAIFKLQGYAGAYLSLPLGQMEVTHRNGSYGADFPLMSGFMAGGGFGIKLGPGVIMADVRYATDFGNVTATYNGTRDVSHRDKLFFSLGYEIGLIPKK